MATGSFTNDWISKSTRILFCGAPSPDPSKFLMGLANTATLTRASSLSDFVNSELLPANGYARTAVSFGNGSYNANNQRYEEPAVTVTFTATNLSLQFQTAFLMADADSTASAVCNNVNAASDRITVAGYTPVNGSSLLFSVDSGGTLPSGITAGSLYQVVNAQSDNSFQLQLPGSSATVDFKDSGSGTFRARFASGSAVALLVESSPITVLPGQSYSYQIPLIMLNSGYTNGV